VKLVVWSDRALKNLERLDSKVADRVTRAVLRFADDRTGDIKKLQGKSDTWRLRIGEYRVSLARTLRKFLLSSSRPVRAPIASNRGGVEIALLTKY
jgi:hypothetical protein